MGAFDRGLGIARSLFVYHLIPRRQRKLTALYRTFLRPDDLAFDVGAHAGNRVRGLAAMGCRVVAVEPQPDFVRLLSVLFGRSARVTIVAAAVTSRIGTETIWLSTRNPTLATSAPRWRDQRSHEPGFAGVEWDRSIQADATTLDALIERFGEPAFVKIDVEGGEPAVLAGLSRPIRTVSFEYLPGALDEVSACLERLSQLGPYEFNWSPGETFQLASDAWMEAPALLAALRTDGAQRTSGDVYARLKGKPQRSQSSQSGSPA